MKKQFSFQVFFFKKRGIVTSCFIVFLWSSVLSQSDNTISGRIIDATNNEPLPGASVVIKGTTIGSITDGLGTFMIKRLPPGDYEIRVTFMGFKPYESIITLRDGESEIVEISMGPDVKGLEEVVIKGSLEGEQKALNIQKNADNIKNVISADLINKFPDLNVAEALQRVPGINIQRDKGEGSTVSIRGTPQHFTTIQINGEQIPSARESGARNEALDLIPADQLSSMEITKAPTPDMDGDAIGGIINLKTPIAKDVTLGLKGETGLGFNDLSGGINGIGRLRLDKRFFPTRSMPEGRLGIMVGASYFGTDNSEDRIDARWITVPDPNVTEDPIYFRDYQYRKTENRRQRMGATLTLDYKFSENSSIIFNFMHNRREDNDVRNRLRFDFDRGGSGILLGSNADSIDLARVRRDINIWDELKINNSFNLQGSHYLKGFLIEWGGYLTLSNRELSSIRGDFARDGIGLVSDNPGGFFVDYPQIETTESGQSIHDPLFYNDFRRYEEDLSLTDASNIVGKLDISKGFQLFGQFDAVVKMGGKVRFQTNSKFRDNVVFAFFDPNQIINQESIFTRIIGPSEPESYLFGRYRYGPRVFREPFNNFIESNRNFLNPSDDSWDSERISLSDTYDAFEDIYAGYGMVRVNFNKLMVLTGLRYEFNEVRYDAFEVLREGTNVVGTPIQGGSDYGFLLPHLHLRYSLSEYTNLRFASTFGYARPNFVDIVPFVNFDVDDITLFIGNPDLQPAASFNLDLMFEHYFKNIGIFSVGWFFKDIDDFQFSRIIPVLGEAFPGYPDSQGFRFRQEQNGENAIVTGIEVNYIQNLDMLPGVLGGLSFIGNYTWAHSQGFTQDRTDIALPGQATHTWNAALAWDYKSFTARVSANFNGAFLHSVASQVEDDIIQDSRLQLDANVSYKLSKRMRVFSEFINITNAPTIRYQGQRSQIARAAYFGWWTRAGLSFRI